MAKTDKTTSPVKVVGGKLILSLTDAKEPVVWQMDLEQAQSAAFTIKEDKKAKSFNLVFKAQGGETETIAPFSDKESAMNILMETSQALQNAQNNIQSAAAVAAAPTRATSEKGDKLGAVLAVILVILLVLSWIAFSSAPEKIARMNSQNGSYSANIGSPRESSGVPVSADDFLSNR